MSVKLGFVGNFVKNRMMTMITIEDLQKVYDSLLECGPDEEDFGWGPTYEYAELRRDKALAILKKAIEEMKKNDNL
jgi:hypothetical protein